MEFVGQEVAETRAKAWRCLRCCFFCSSLCVKHLHAFAKKTRQPFFNLEIFTKNEIMG